MLLTISCKEQASKRTSGKELQSIFPKGQLGSAENFTGKASSTGLVAHDPTCNILVGNVYFEPGARSNWRIPPGGQILVVMDNGGHYQEKGKPAQVLHKGDVVRVLPDVEHWHGASHDSAFTPIAINTNTQKGKVAWLESVTDEAYNSIK